MRSVIGAIKLFIFFLSALFTLAYQSIVLLFTKGDLAFLYPRAYHAFLCRLMGIRVVVEGEIETAPHTVYVGNHLSYLDIEALGSVLKGSFVAKKEVASWPFIGWLGHMGQTLYISRDPKDAASVTFMLLKRLATGHPLIIFTEGTSSIGKSILPFKSSLFEIFLNQNITLQPFTISLLEVDGEKPVTDTVRDKYCWYGDMSFEPHLWRFIKSKGASVKVSFQKPILTSSYSDRKSLSADCYESVRKGLDLSPLSQ